MVELRTHDGVPDEQAVVERWHALVDADPLGTAFHTPEYLGLWVRVLGGRYSARVHEVRDHDEVIGLVPVGLAREGSATGPIEVIRFLGGTDVTDYRGPITLPDARDAVAHAYLERLADDADWDEFVASGVVADSGWEDAWTAAAESAGLVLDSVSADDVCPRIDLSRGYQGWLDGLDGRRRQELKRKTRKLARAAGELELVEITDPDALDEALERFVGMNVDAGGDKAGFFASDDHRRWFEALLDELAPHGTVRFHELHAGGLPAAACVSVVGQGEWGVYNSAFDDALASYAPGVVIVGELIRRAAEEGYEVVDLLRGNEAYKYEYGASDRSMRQLTFTRDGR